MQAIFFFSERVFDYQSNDKQLGIELQKNIFTGLSQEIILAFEAQIDSWTLIERIPLSP